MKSNLKQILLERKLSQRKFRAITGLHITTISKVCNNEFEDITLKVFATMCFHLQCKLNELIDIKAFNEYALSPINHEKKNLISLKAS